MDAILLQRDMETTFCYGINLIGAPTGANQSDAFPENDAIRKALRKLKEESKMNGQYYSDAPRNPYLNQPQAPVDPICKSARDISITRLLRGYSVKVGCQSIAFETAESMCKELLRYYKNPAKVEEEYLATK